jgi:hypothetical protein
MDWRFASQALEVRKLRAEAENVRVGGRDILDGQRPGEGFRFSAGLGLRSLRGSDDRVYHISFLQ